MEQSSITSMDEPMIRVMALHALGYCERLFYLEEVEEIRVADASVYDGRRFHELIPEYSAIERLTLESEKLGIYGRVDCVRTAKGKMIPFEYKKGRSRQASASGGEVEAWPSDLLQIGAYALLLEEHTGKSISEGRVYYAADRKTAAVPIDRALRKAVKVAIERAHALRKSTERPSIAENEKLCGRCSLAPVCLPEEERLIQQPERETVRLFPEKYEALDVHVLDPGCTVRRSGESLLIDRKDADKKTYPIRQIRSVTLHGNCQMTTQTLQMCATNGISVHWVTSGGNYVGSLTHAAGGVQRRLRQYEGLRSEDVALSLARRLIAAKIEGQLRYLLRVSRGNEKRAEFQSQIQFIRNMLKRALATESRNELLGYEGAASKAYFFCFAMLTAPYEASGMAFERRSKRPPENAFNAAMSFMYSLLYRDCVQAIVTVGLDPAIGFYHQPRSSAYPLAMDLMEIFRVPLVDMILLGSVNRNQWVWEEDFTSAGKQVWLSDKGRKKAIQLYESRKQDTWKHPAIGYSLSYARHLELEVRLLEKEWSGRPGLFAVNRIR